MVLVSLHIVLRSVFTCNLLSKNSDDTGDIICKLCPSHINTVDVYYMYDLEQTYFLQAD